MDCVTAILQTLLHPVLPLWLIVGFTFPVKMPIHEYSGNTHSINVAYYSFLFAKFLEKKLGARINYEILIVSAMFHDFFLYDWHETEGRPKLHGFRHPRIASENAQKFYDINETEKNIIESHMWPLTLTKFPKSTEGKIICLIDKCCSTAETFKRA